jgi:hypothetical protein
MVQYYRDMWAKLSEMLAPLTDLVGECSKTKTTKTNKTQKKPWRWDPIHQCRHKFSGKPISTYMSLTLARLCGEWRNDRTGVLG